jgi:hypothetical protein
VTEFICFFENMPKSKSPVFAISKNDYSGTRRNLQKSKRLFISSWYFSKVKCFFLPIDEFIAFSNLRFHVLKSSSL